MGVTPASDGEVLHLCLGEPGPTHICCSATKPRWSGSPTYSWGSGITSGYHLSESPGPHLFCKDSGSVSALPSS